MTGHESRIAQGETPGRASPRAGPEASYVVVRYWAAARAAAGVAEDRVPVDGPVALADLRDRALALHPDSPRLAQVVAACSVLVGDRPLGTRDPAAVLVEPGTSVEFLPPFAGG
jgi:molybdopterin converting factor small subunit